MLTNGELTMETAKLKPIINSMKAEDALSIAAEAAAQIAAANASILKPTAKIELIAIGSSTGGTEALATVLPALRPPLPPIVIVQHIPVGFSKLFADRINKECILSVKEAEDGDIAKANSVYIAPGGLHMSVKKWEGTIKILCHTGPKVHACRPAVDVLFKSIAQQFKGGSAMGVILTGIGHDGTDGLLEMKKQGSPTIGQDEATSVVYGMPKSAFDCGAVDKQLPLQSIAGAIMYRVQSRE